MATPYAVTARSCVRKACGASRRAASMSSGSVPPAAGSGPLVTLSTQAQDGRVTIVIADRGAGIEPAHLPHVFDPYFTTKRGGTGLGLAIAKNIVEGLGGTISVASERTRGTEIQIILPMDLVRESPGRAERWPADGHSARGRATILDLGSSSSPTTPRGSRA